MTTLTPNQQMHLKNVRASNENWRRAKRDANARALLLAAEEIESHRNKMDQEVRLAYDSGVPKIQLRTEGLGTKDPNTLEDSLRRTQAAAIALAGRISSDPLAQRYSWDDGTEQLRVCIDGTTSEFFVKQRANGTLYITPIQFAEQTSVEVWMDAPANEKEAIDWYEDHI